MQVNRPDEPSYAGGATFSKLPLVLDASELKGGGRGHHGRAHRRTRVEPAGGQVRSPRHQVGRRVGRVASPRPNLDVGVDPFEVLAVVDFGDAEVVPGDQTRSHEAIRRAVGEVAAAGAIPIVLGGDHSIAHPDVGAVADSLKPDSLGLVHFDAHADNADTVYGVRLSHGTPLRRLVEEGSLRGENIVQVGLRGYWPDPPDFEWARQQGFRWFLMEEISERGMNAVMDDVVAVARAFDHLFLSFDIDVCDPAFAPGTGTPEPGGITAREALRAVRRLSFEVGLAGMEVVEVSPPYDHAEITALLANRLVLEALSGLALRRLGRNPAPERSNR